MRWTFQKKLLLEGFRKSLLKSTRRGKIWSLSCLGRLPTQKDYTWDPEELAETYEKWLKTENERLDSEESERKTVRKLRVQKVQDDSVDKTGGQDRWIHNTEMIPMILCSTLIWTQYLSLKFYPGGYLSKESETTCSVVNDSSTVTTTSSSLTPPTSRLSGDISMSVVVFSRETSKSLSPSSCCAQNPIFYHV